MQPEYTFYYVAINVTHSETKYKWILGNAGMRRSVTAFTQEQEGGPASQNSHNGMEENGIREQKNKKS